MKTLLISSAISAMVAFGAGWQTNEWRLGGQILTMELGAAKATEKAVKDALEAEREQRTKLDENTRKQHEQVTAINAALELELERLRARPNRPVGMPETPRVDCEGASGPELGREHAEFLARYAALSAKQDAALEACYRYADDIRKLYE
jgi:hypothetical protein